MRPLVVFIVGPTAVGKSDLAMNVARWFGGEIVNCDSVQVYSEVEIGTAKPSQEAQKEIPHHLLGVVPAGALCTVNDFRRNALCVIRERSANGVGLFYCVGGSGFYVRALLTGLYKTGETPDDIRESVRQDFEKKGREFLLDELIARDPVYAKKIGSRDTYRMMRALEVLRHRPGLTMARLHEEFQATPPPFDYFKIGLNADKKWIHDRVIMRAMAMVDGGLIEEVRGLLDRGLGSWKPLSSVGYKETRAFLDGSLSRESLVSEIVRNTMGLVKRQRTWWKKDPEVEWFDAALGWNEPLKAMGKRIASLDTLSKG